MKHKKFSNSSRKEGKRSGITPSAGMFTPDRKTTTLRWSFSGSAAASSSYAENVFSGNGLFDPGLTSSATQPVGFDQYALWYNRYQVSVSRITLTMQMYSTSATPTATAVGARVCLYPSNTAAVASSMQEAMAQPRATFKEVGLLPVVFTQTLSSVKALGFDGRNKDTTDSAGIGAQPTAQWYWHFAFQSGAYTSIETVLMAHIDYVSHFFYRVTQPLSLLMKLQKDLNDAMREEIKRRESLPFEPLFKEIKTESKEHNQSLPPPTDADDTSKPAVSLSSGKAIPFVMIKRPASALSLTSAKRL